MEEKITSSVKKFLDMTIEKKASDLHLSVGVAPTLRIDGRLMAIPEESVLTGEACAKLVKSLMTEDQVSRIEEKKELDFSFSYKEMRFRTNAFYQKGYLQASLRMITHEIKSLTDLGMPPILEKFTVPSQGFVIITGPTGHGKSTTLAAMVEHINKTRTEHIITIEDPIEYVFEHKKSIISQREIGSDTFSFARALRSALREDPNVVLVGEMRDLETIEAALTVAETGHLVFTTLHTNSAAQTADRIIDVFPPHQQQQVRMQLANVLLGVVSQRLIPKTNGGRIAASEIMIANSAVKNLIREGKTHQLNNIIQTSASEGMISLDKVLAELVSKGDITLDDALTWALDPKSFKMMVY
ncbi:type IV pili twitching motility protein PilT [Candidatus Berkelbacteria bacterium RIFCSPHIGHO2_12_FULL_36_9]|uniref:Type IV pili twitching motility protein PilT n=1 Tax=Candidatus Berkelbacteria bacterium RIFCSPHIGHO2_12_FULL_36_9 TaxID=1797469 RepID=A0A1F5EEL2_9BACT|nr:MAG: type IV pili twitching motility protein PilT [Candidatus Berkelbacteria bacterium RIFCSPHIGHO2_12_FULL_36_9]